MTTTIRPTGTLYAIGWPVLAIGLFLIVGLFSHPYIGAIVFAAGLTLLIMATRRAAANREAVQRATLDAANRQA